MAPNYAALSMGGWPVLHMQLSVLGPGLKVY